MIHFSSRSDFSNLRKKLNKKGHNELLTKYGEIGVAKLKQATPVRTGKTANSWYFKCENNELKFYNSNVNEGVLISILIQYGHVTGTGGWIEGHDYINPIINEITADLVRDLRMED